MSSNEDAIYDIINTLDNFVSSDHGHINLVINEDNIDFKQVNSANTSSCAVGDLACNIPTLFDGVED